MKTAHLDCETYSPVNLKVAGLSRYTEHPETDIWFLWFVIVGPGIKPALQFWDPSLPPPAALFEADHFVAHNAGFERAIWWKVLYQRHRWPDCPDLSRWTCSMALGQSFALPGDLDMMAAILGAPRKDSEGKALIQRWCKPRRDGKRPSPDDDPASFERFKGYGANDVRAEHGVLQRLPRQEFTPSERRVWEHQMRVNERGIYVDIPTTITLSRAVEKCKAQLSKEAKAIARGLEPTQVAALREWLMTDEGIEVPNLRAETIRDLLKTMPEGNARRVLEIRSEVSKTSTAKYDALLKRVSMDCRLRNSMMYHGASTGRVTHKGFQPGNLPSRSPIHAPHELIEQTELIADPHSLAVFERPMEAYSAMVRSVLIASKGRRLMSGDYSQIEARKNAYLAGQADLLALFASDADPYCYMAGKIFHRPASEIRKGSRERFLGKETTLGAGFGMGGDGFYKYCLKKGAELTREEAHNAIEVFRETYPTIVKFWYIMRDAAVAAVDNAGQAFPARSIVYKASRDRKWLFCKLPSGRLLSYYKPRLEPGMYGAEVFCEGINSITHRWGEVSLWYGTLVENVVQACSRDIMVEAALRLEAAGYPMVLSVHDEILCDVPDKPSLTLAEFTSIMSEPVAWAPGLPIKVESWEGRRYRK